VKYCNFSKIILIGTPWEANTRSQLHFVKLRAHDYVHKCSPLVSVTSSPLCKLYSYHRSQMLIIIGYTFLECTSSHRNILRTTILTYKFYPSMFQPKLYEFTCGVIPTICTVNTFEFLQLPPWKWPNEWPKHVGDRYVIKLHSQIKCIFCLFDKFYISN